MKGHNYAWRVILGSVVLSLLIAGYAVADSLQLACELNTSSSTAPRMLLAQTIPDEEDEFPLSMVLDGRAGETATASNASENNCDMATYPPLPANAMQPPTKKKHGWVWLAGHNRCVKGEWQYFKPRWVPKRANQTVDPMALVEFRDGRVFAKTGYIFKETSDKGSFAVTPTMAAGGLGATSEVSFMCGCACALPIVCSAIKQANCNPKPDLGNASIACVNDGCAGECKITHIVINSGLHKF